MLFSVYDLGLVDFQLAYQFQRKTFDDVKRANLNAALILCQHHPIISLGRQIDKNNILSPKDELERNGIAIYQTSRGGGVTYHGPGQLTAYPIFNLNFFKKDIHLFLRQLEEVIIEFLLHFTVEAQRFNGLTGVWVRGEKIASIGIAIKNWITMHGISINIKKNDLGNFSFIKPCGMNIAMTSLETASSKVIEIGDVKEILTSKFKEAFYLE